MDVKEKHSKIVVFYLAKSFTEKLETREFHGSTIFYTFFNDLAIIIVYLKLSCSWL